MNARILPLLLLTLLALVPGIAPAQATAAHDADILRYIVATRQAASFKDGIRSAVAEEGGSNAILDAVLALPDAEIEAAVLVQLRQHLDGQEARALADFYDSDTGREITRQQVAQLDATRPVITLTPAQRAEHAAFLFSLGGEAERRLLAPDQQDAIWAMALPEIVAAARKRL